MPNKSDRSKEFHRRRISKGINISELKSWENDLDDYMLSMLQPQSR